MGVVCAVFLVFWGGAFPPLSTLAYGDRWEWLVQFLFLSGGLPLASQYWPCGDRLEWPVLCVCVFMCGWGGVILSPLNNGLMVTDWSGLYSGVVSSSLPSILTLW